MKSLYTTREWFPLATSTESLHATVRTQNRSDSVLVRSPNQSGHNAPAISKAFVTKRKLKWIFWSRNMDLFVR